MKNILGDLISQHPYRNKRKLSIIIIPAILFLGAVFYQLGLEYDLWGWVAFVIYSLASLMIFMMGFFAQQSIYISGTDLFIQDHIFGYQRLHIQIPLKSIERIYYGFDRNQGHYAMVRPSRGNAGESDMILPNEIIQKRLLAVLQERTGLIAENKTIPDLD